ncbi:MAG TPA: chemotaxis protein CheW [Syntrophomonadaceae bacterium]|nr:chemotaxis protein CheW [Syntrophomonadaceae bacterium]
MDESTQINQKRSYELEEQIQVVAFQLGQEEYAVNILDVLEINRLLNITRVPRADVNIDGVINLRGNIIPIINLHRRFDLEALEDDDEQRIIVFQFDEVKAGIIVDRVSEVLYLNRSQIEASERVYSAMDSNFIEGIAKVDDRLLILLNVKRLLGIESL